MDVDAMNKNSKFQISALNIIKITSIIIIL